MADYTHDFNLTAGHTWLNVASEGPLPAVSAHALTQAVAWKSSPHLLTHAKFHQVPQELKKSLSQLLQVNPQDIILGNSATYGLHLLANGLPLNTGDEIILMQNDFPTNILPWLSLQHRGVIVHQVEAQHHMLTIEEIKRMINRNTRIVCCSYVHTFSGHAADVQSIGKLCRHHGALFILNISQAAGAFPINLSEFPVDAVVGAGYKWLLGPYGTGFCWIAPALRQTLDYAQNYWINLMDEQSLSSEGKITLNEDHSSRRYDIFGTANFFNYVPWRASIDYLLSIGLTKVQLHNQHLVDLIINGLDKQYFTLISPTAKNERTNIVVFSHKDPQRNNALFDHLTSHGFYLALWKGKLRASPHIYNTTQDINQFLKIIHHHDH